MTAEGVIVVGACCPRLFMDDGAEAGIGHNLGSIFPVLSVSTSSTNGRIDSTL